MSMREQNQMYEMQIENLKEQLKLRESEYEEDILKIKQQITSEQKLGQRHFYIIFLFLPIKNYGSEKLSTNKNTF